MQKLIVLAIFCLITVVNCVSKPRGVSLSKAHFYKVDEPFSCLDGSGKISWSMVNDDYCDCRDASDEPGTAACSNGFFHCDNNHHKSVFIPSSRVNDGICDCCDGSDEFNGLASCKSICWEIGKAAREETDRRRVLMAEGHQVYQEYLKQAQEKLESKKSRLETLDSEIEEVEKERSIAQEQKNSAEEPEKTAKTAEEDEWKKTDEKAKEENNKAAILVAFGALDTNKDSKVSVDEMQTHIEFDIDQNGEVSPQEAKEYLDDNDTVDEVLFTEKIWPNIKDLYKSPSEKPAEPDLESEENDSEEPALAESIVKDEEHKSDNASSFQPETVRDYSEATKLLMEAADKARSQFNEHDEKYNALVNEKKEATDLLGHSYGPENAFFPLAESSECYELSDREYTYRLCPFKEATQSGKDSGGPSLGKWGRWEPTPNGNEFGYMIYENGQSCWNGPNRSAKILVSCGPKNQLLSVSEPSRCTYLFEFATPAACHLTPEQLAQHDEL